MTDPREAGCGLPFSHVHIPPHTPAIKGASLAFAEKNGPNTRRTVPKGRIHVSRRSYQAGSFIRPSLFAESMIHRDDNFNPQTRGDKPRRARNANAKEIKLQAYELMEELRSTFGRKLLKWTRPQGLSLSKARLSRSKRAKPLSTSLQDGRPRRAERICRGLASSESWKSATKSECSCVRLNNSRGEAVYLP